MSEKNVSINQENHKIENRDNQMNNNSKLSNKPTLKRRNAVVNFELLESYQEFIKQYKMNNQVENQVENKTENEKEK